MADPLQALQAALTAPADSKEQTDLLASLRETLEAQPGPIPLLCTTLIKTVAGAGDTLLKRWVLELLQYALGRSALPPDTKTQLATQTLDTLCQLLHDRSTFTVKIVVQCFCSVYPLLFRLFCASPNPMMRQQWDMLVQAKTKIIEWVWSPAVSAGVKLAAVRFLQRVILLQTRGVSDPRLQNKTDPNIAMCPSNHPFIPVAALETEGTELLKSVITILWSSQNVDILSAILNSWVGLAKQRPALTGFVVTTLAHWKPAALAGLPASEVKSAEKAVRILLVHLSRAPQGAAHATEISAALAAQAERMDRASAEEKTRRAQVAAEAARIKRPPDSQPSGDTKRAKTEHVAGANAIASFDFSSLPAALITDLVVANLQAFSEEDLDELVRSYRVRTGLVQPEAPKAPRDPRPVSKEKSLEVVEDGDAETEMSIVKEEEVVVNPLEMNVEGEEIEYEPDRLNQELAPSAEDIAEAESKIPLDLDLADFKLPAPRSLEEGDRDVLVRGSMTRLWDDGVKEAEGPPELWMLLVVRMITRVVYPDTRQEDDAKDEGDSMDVDEDGTYERQERMRQTLCDYIMKDFPARVRLATTWMSEEWYNDRIRMQKGRNWRPNYDTWLNQIVAAYQTQLDAKDKMFSRFLLDIPSVPLDVFALVRDLCVDPERREVGFTALRGFVIQRPSLRDDAMTVLLDLTTHPEKLTRAAAINTVRRWLPDAPPMDGMIKEFALQMLRRLQKATPSPAQDGGDGSDGEDGELPAEPAAELVQTPYLTERIGVPAKKEEVLQHVELLFALSVKVQEFLDEIFAAYGQMEESVQNVVQELITPLIRSLGSGHGRLLTLLRTFPSGAETLALRVLQIFTEHGRPSAPLVSLVKSLIAERDLPAQFLMPIIGEMDKADIHRHLPRIVSMLNGTPENKTLVRAVFGSIVTTPPQTFGTVTSNLPRVRQSELLTPAELMVILHHSEQEIGLKSAMEAIGICFSMTDVYRSEILAVVMQQIVDEPVLPTLFLRTVIQAVQTYKSLVGFVSTTLLSRLITKKIWTNAPLWAGFIRCAKAIAPASFGALLQLPKEQLRDLVERQPDLKAGLRDYVLKKAGNRARVGGILDLFGEEEEQKPES